jgi:hypothetical protein
MNTGQLLLTIGGMFLLSLVILRVNNNFLSTNYVMMNSKLGITAVSLGTSFIEEASSKAFDEVTADSSITLSSESQLTLPNNLNPDGAEVYPNFNDFDDYNNLNVTDTIPFTGIFNIKCKVSYVNLDTTVASADKIIPSNNRTWYKKLEVDITSLSIQKPDGSPDTLKFYSVFSYWK